MTISGEGPACPLAYDDTSGPTRPAVLLVHAGVCDRRMWQPQWTELREAGYRVLRADLRGYGDTPASTRPYRDAEDLLALLDAARVGRAAVVAASFGGEVALELAARWPERVVSLLLLSAGRPGLLPGPALTAFAEQEDALLDAGEVAAATELNVRTWLTAEADDATRAQVREMQGRAFALDAAAEAAAGTAGDVAAADSGGDDEPVIDLSRIPVPVLAVSGALDLPEFRETAAELPRLLPHASHRELSWAGHLPSLERPAELTGLIRRFLSETHPVAA